MNIPAALYEDEVVCFLADRYHATPWLVLYAFLVQDKRISELEEYPVAFRLEDNEMEILRGLTCVYHSL